MIAELAEATFARIGTLSLGQEARAPSAAAVAQFAVQPGWPHSL
jgi:hypothetical protein